jgi:hypothetical protein
VQNFCRVLRDTAGAIFNLMPAAPGKRGWPHVAPGDIEHNAAQRIVARGFANTLLGGLRSGL